MRNSAAKGGRQHPSSLVWSALADPTRREILDLLKDGPRTSGELARHFPTSRFAIRKHLNILEAAHLVIVRWHGRERWNHLNVTPIQSVYQRWVTPYQRIWAERLSQLKSNLEGDHDMPPGPAAIQLERIELEIPIAAAPPVVWRALLEDTTM